MFLWHRDLLKMKVNKLILPCSILVKLQPLYCTNKTLINRVELQSFSLGSWFFSYRVKEAGSNISFTGVEQLTSFPKISKKKNKLSTVEEIDFELLESLKKGENLQSFENPFKKIKRILIKDSKLFLEKASYFLTKVEFDSLKPQYFDNSTDILIIGGGAVGLSIAYAIRNQFPYGPKVTVMDKDSSCPHLSTNLGQGVVSLQLFNEEEEISILKYGAEFFSAFTRNTEIEENLKFKLNYDPLGSLLLVDESNVEQVMKNHENLKMFDVNNKILDRESLKKKFPWLNIENILFGSLGMHSEGIIDPWIYIYGLKCKCVSLGVKFLIGEVIDFGYENRTVRRAICKLPNGSYDFVDFAYCILAGGLESLNIVHLLNCAKVFELELKLPMEERMRYEYCFYSSDGPGLNTPIIFNPDGTYFRREGLTGHYVAGVPSVISNNDENESNPYHVFERIIKPFLIKRLPNLQKLDLLKGWIDAYDFCLSNKVGITGPHPCSNQIVFALGFSHLGLQYLPALGRGVMEFVIYDTYQTINFEPFHVENLWRKQHLEADRKRKEFIEAQQQVALSK